MRVLVVDDAMFMRNSLRMILERNAIEVVGMAGNGIEAIAQYKALKPDVVTMDITMPDMDGLTAVDAILREDPAARILVVSALADKSTSVEAIKRGAQGFLLKPITPDSLREAVTELLET